MKSIASALIFILLLGAAPAGAGPSTPKRLCLQDGLVTILLAIKKQANVKTADGKAQFYSIDGVWMLEEFARPLGGSGYLAGNTFHFTFTMALFEGEPPELHTSVGEGAFDLATRETEVAVLTQPGDHETVLLPAEVDCRGVPGPVPLRH